ncbi:MAG: hypothetical protein U0401_13900 [Anaerolineae bacterium]
MAATRPPLSAGWGAGRWLHRGGGGDLAVIRPLYRLVEEAWQAEGRPAATGSVALYCAANGTRPERAAAYLRQYYRFLGAGAERFVQGAATSAEAPVKAKSRL